jgi:hypothetical protein
MPEEEEEEEEEEIEIEEVKDILPNNFVISK